MRHAPDHDVRATEDRQIRNQLNRLEHFNQFISGIATAIVAGNQDFESVWSIANRVYEQHCSPKVRYMTDSGLDHAKQPRSAPKPSGGLLAVQFPPMRSVVMRVRRRDVACYVLLAAWKT